MAKAQGTVQKTNPMPLYMHYMPWFDTPETSGTNQWGWHWTMNNRNPNNIDQETGQHDIASHYYPLIGPYASSDPDVLEYHLLLMKYAGIDGILIDWYGEKGTNGDITNLLRNSNVAIGAAEKTGLKFGVVLEDRFAASVKDAKENIIYLDHNYFNHPLYIRQNNDPLVAVFGPITFQQPAQWTEILGASSHGIEFLPLWHESKDAGGNADGEYAWIWEDESQDNFFSHLESFYKVNAPALKTVLGVAYPGFMDYYKEGGAGGGYFEIPHEDGETLAKLLDLANDHKEKIDALQIATWNDFGEGTMIEPTLETGFNFLLRLQEFSGVEYTGEHLMMIYKLFLLKKKYKDDAATIQQLNSAASHLGDLEVVQARSILDTFEPVTAIHNKETGVFTFHIFPNPLSRDTLNVQLTETSRPAPIIISVSDVSGKTVLTHEVEAGTNQFTIPSGRFKKGIYHINLKMSGKTMTTRLIVLE